MLKAFESLIILTTSMTDGNRELKMRIKHIGKKPRLLRTATALALALPLAATLAACTMPTSGAADSSAGGRVEAVNTPRGTAAPLTTVSTPAPVYPGDSSLRSSCTVTLLTDANGEAIKQNIEHAAQIINADGGIKVAPNEEWSFLNAFAPFQESNGWTLAAGIVDGVYYENIGCAGIDQVATALYCALLEGDITVLERTGHSFPQAYADAGLDASVSTDTTDLKLLNDTGEELIIRCKVGEEVDSKLPITIELHGAALPDGAAYRLRSEITQTIARGETKYIDDPTLSAGETELLIRGRDGCEVSVYRDTVAADGTVLESTFLYSDSYRAVNELWARGSGSAAIEGYAGIGSTSVTDAAETVLGKPYQLGASGPDAFDSSGLIYYALNQAGLAVERQTCKGYSETEEWEKIADFSDLRPGDLLFFNGKERGSDIQHAGIYVGDGRMIDASSSANEVVQRRCETTYWQKHFAFARRVVK